MSSAHLDLVRSIYADWERGDFGSAEWADPEIEYVIADGLFPRASTGLGTAAENLGEDLRAWKDIRVEVDEYREIDSERILVFARYLGAGKVSGLEIEQMRAGGAHLLHLRGGKVTKLVHYWDRERALADLGLTPETDSPAA